VKHPDEVLPEGEKLPLVIFAFPRHNKIILETIRSRYPAYSARDIVLCMAAL
jgi:hypothetical protein